MVDQFDIKILDILNKNARLSLKQIGKKVGRSKQFISYRINRLKEEEIITGYAADLNFRELNYTLFNIFIQLKNLTKKTEDEILDYFSKSPLVGFCLKLLGNWDIYISVRAKNVGEFYEFLGGIHEKFKENIKKESINLEIRGTDTNLKFLGDSKKDYISTNSLPREALTLKKIEKDIILILRKDPLISYLEIAEKTSISYETAKKIVENLRKKNILKRIRALIDTKKIGYENYLFLIELNFLEMKKREELISYLSYHKNINYIIESIGNLNLVCSVYSKNTTELLKVIESLRSKFKETISTIEFLKIINPSKQSFDIV